MTTGPSYTVRTRLHAPEGVIYGPAGAESLVGSPFSVTANVRDLQAELKGVIVRAELAEEGRAVDIVAEVGPGAPQPEPHRSEAPNPLAYFLGGRR